MKIKTSLLIALLGMVNIAQAQNSITDTVKTKLLSRLDSVSYAMGASIATDLKSRKVTEVNYELVILGLKDVFAGKPTSLSLQQGQQCIMDYLTYVKKVTAEPLIAEATRFLEQNKKKKGMFVTPSGLQYEILKTSNGPKPKATDEVTVHYKGTLTNGKPFDSSYDRNEPFKTFLNQVIPGWTEGVQLMSVGSQYRFFIPSQLAYGENGAGADIPAYSVLIFEIELLKIGQ